MGKPKPPAPPDPQETAGAQTAQNIGTAITQQQLNNVTPDEQATYGNGVGPDWFPDGLRHLITNTASWFFADASWRHHDFGYAVGGDRWDRARCDWKFFTAMLRDAISQSKWRILSIPLALLIAVFFYAMVRAFGFASYNYRN